MTMGRKPVLVIAGALVTGLALTGCQSGPDRRPLASNTNLTQNTKPGALQPGVVQNQNGTNTQVTQQGGIQNQNPSFPSNTALTSNPGAFQNRGGSPALPGGQIPPDPQPVNKMMPTTGLPAGGLPGGGLPGGGLPGGGLPVGMPTTGVPLSSNLNSGLPGGQATSNFTPTGPATTSIQPGKVALPSGPVGVTDPTVSPAISSSFSGPQPPVRQTSYPQDLNTTTSNRMPAPVTGPGLAIPPGPPMVAPVQVAPVQVRTIDGAPPIQVP
jgi:hypothetical protein